MICILFCFFVDKSRIKWYTVSINQRWKGEVREVRFVCIGVLCLLSLVLLLSCNGAKAVPPEACETRALIVAKGGEHPSAADFLTNAARALCDERGIEVTFAVPPDFETTGERTLALLIGGKTVETVCRVADDVTPPTFSGVRDLSFPVGAGAVLREGVSVEDDCFGAVEWTVDASVLDTSRAGYYAVYYRACDASGNATECIAYVTVYAEEITQAQLDAACDEYLSRLIPASADREQVCRLIYAGLQASLEYWPVSDKTSPVRAAYLALFRDGRGDCYSYFSAACALLARAGIEYLEIERIHDVGEETHYWLMVNLADKGETPRWYHFDPTELDTHGFPHDGCLFTDTELDAYNAFNVGFYDYDRSLYPPSAPESLRR